MKPVRNQPVVREAFLDRETETARLMAAIKARQSLLICGPPGVGKTALVFEVLNHLPQDIIQSTFYLSGVEGIRPLLWTVLRQLHEKKDSTLLDQLTHEGVQEDKFEVWLAKQVTSRLKGAVYRSMEQGEYRIILDHATTLSAAMAKVVKELIWMRHTPVYLTSHGPSVAEIGHISNLYWSDRFHLVLEPLPEPAAEQLLDMCIDQFGLTQMDLKGFHEEILQQSKRIPGAIKKMCELAALPRYQYGRRVKMKLLHIDYLMTGYDHVPKT